MAFIDDFADCLNDTVTLERLTGRDVYGKPTYAAPITYTARLVRRARLVRSQAGDEVVSSAHVWIGTTGDTNDTAPPEIGPDDRITLSSGETPTILTSERYQDETGTDSHSKVFFR